MPIAHVHILRGRPIAQRKAILDGLHAALVEAFQIPDSDRTQILHEHDPENFELERGPDFTLIELTIFPGRSVGAKRLLYTAVVRNLEQCPGIPREKILVVLHALALTAWGIRGGRPASEVDIALRLNV